MHAFFYMHRFDIFEKNNSVCIIQLSKQAKKVWYRPMYHSEIWTLHYESKHLHDSTPSVRTMMDWGCAVMQMFCCLLSYLLSPISEEIKQHAEIKSRICFIVIHELNWISESDTENPEPWTALMISTVTIIMFSVVLFTVT